MKARDLAIETWSALDANRGRSLLTILGIVIGISAVIAMTALIGGINKALVGELGLSQAQLIYINVFGDKIMTSEDVDRIGENLTDYQYVIGNSFGSAKVTTGSKSASGNLTGVSSEYFEAMQTKLLAGRTFTEAEDRSGAMVLVVDKGSLRILFGNEDAEAAVGKTVRVGNDECQIIGVVEGSGSSLGNSESVNGYLPSKALASRVTGNDEVMQIMGFAREGVDIDQLVEKTEDYLVKTYNIPEDEKQSSISVNSMKSVIEQVNATTGSFAMLMTVVAGISLLVGGIGIMNMMLTNVTERIREIGLRKALGARRADITRQFMLESVCLCLVGGLIGVVLGYLGAFALSGLATSALMGSGSSTSVTPAVDGGTVLMATIICVVTGIIFGWYPARRAARLDPVESLHYQ